MIRYIKILLSITSLTCIQKQKPIALESIVQQNFKNICFWGSGLALVRVLKTVKNNFWPSASKNDNFYLRIMISLFLNSGFCGRIEEYIKNRFKLDIAIHTYDQIIEAMLNKNAVFYSATDARDVIKNSAEYIADGVSIVLNLLNSVYILCTEYSELTLFLRCLAIFVCTLMFSYLSTFKQVIIFDSLIDEAFNVSLGQDKQNNKALKNAFIKDFYRCKTIMSKNFFIESISDTINFICVVDLMINENRDKKTIIETWFKQLGFVTETADQVYKCFGLRDKFDSINKGLVILRTEHKVEK